MRGNYITAAFQPQANMTCLLCQLLGLKDLNCHLPPTLQLQSAEGWFKIMNLPQPYFCETCKLGSVRVLGVFWVFPPPPPPKFRRNLTVLKIMWKLERSKCSPNAHAKIVFFLWLSKKCVFHSPLSQAGLSLSHQFVFPPSPAALPLTLLLLFVLFWLG